MDNVRITVTGDSEVTVSGNIKSIEDYHVIKKTVMGMVDKGRRSVTVNIIESISMTSSVIGFFIKLVNADKVKISMNVKDERLFNLLGLLNQITMFDVKKLK